MKDPRFLLLACLLLLCLMATRPVIYTSPGCNDFEFKAEVSQASGQGLATLTIIANGGRAPYHYLLFDNKNNLVSKDFSISRFTGLAAGHYRCIVTDADDCTKEQHIEVK